MISGNYIEIPNAELPERAAEFAAAWQDPSLPEKQWAVVKTELDRWAIGARIAPYSALVNCWGHMPRLERPALLDVGAALGSYRNVLAGAGIHVDYTGVDYSAAFVAFGRKQFPGINLNVADALALPYSNCSFDVVLHGACIMHLFDYQQAIREAVRVAKRYVIFSRTPVFTGGIATTFYQKEAYGVPCGEWRFNEAELLGIFKSHGLKLLHTANVFLCESEGYGHRTYLLEKMPPEPYASDLNV